MAEQSLKQKIFEAFMTPKKAGDLFLENLPLAVKKVLTPSPYSGDSSLLFFNPTPAQYEEAQIPPTEEELLADSVSFMPAAGATRFAKEYGPAADRWVKEAIRLPRPTDLFQSRAAQLEELRKNYRDVLNATKEVDPMIPKGVQELNKVYKEELRQRVKDVMQGKYDGNFMDSVNSPEIEAYKTARDIVEPNLALQEIQGGTSQFKKFQKEFNKRSDNLAATLGPVKDKNIFNRAEFIAQERKQLEQELASKIAAKNKAAPYNFQLPEEVVNQAKELSRYARRFEKQKEAQAKGLKNLFESAKNHNPVTEMDAPVSKAENYLEKYIENRANTKIPFEESPSYNSWTMPIEPNFFKQEPALKVLDENGWPLDQYSEYLKRIGAAAKTSITGPKILTKAQRDAFNKWKGKK